ncbi:7-cyano-7-deazaguanine synthase [Acidobacteriota bacterium]
MKTAVMLFSGGVDSTYTVTTQASNFDSITLLTYQVPGMINTHFSEKTSRQLIEKFGDKIEHKIIDITEFVNSLRGNAAQCIKDNIRYKFFYSWCLGCKLSMHLYTLRYCQEHKIQTIIDGSNRHDLHALEQSEPANDFFAEIYKKNNIDYFSPINSIEDLNLKKSFYLDILKHLSLHRESTKVFHDRLEEKGFDMGFGIFCNYRATQPSCLVSVPFNIVRLPYKFLFGEKQGSSSTKYGYLNYLKDLAERAEQIEFTTKSPQQD